MNNCLSRNSLQKNCFRAFAPAQLSLNNSPWTIVPHQVPLRATIEKCFKLRRFESELHRSKASIAIGDPSRGEIVNPLLELWLFSIFFHWCSVNEEKLK